MNMTLTKSIRQILLVCGSAAFAASTFAAVGIQNPPPGPGMVPDYFGVVPNYANSPQPVLATVTITAPIDSSGTQATAAATTYDYSSPNPGAYIDGIADIQVLNPGAGYTSSDALSVTVNGNGTGASATAIINGITGITVTNGGSGYNPAKPPIFTITSNSSDSVVEAATAIATVDPKTHAITGITVTSQGSGGYLHKPTIRLGSNTGQVFTGATANFNTTVGAITGFTINNQGTGYNTPIARTGLKKFVDMLPGIPNVSSYVSGADYTNGVNNLGQALPLAVPDTTTFPGSDYYVISESVYTQQLHSDLPATHLRGYMQINSGTASGCTPPPALPATTPAGACNTSDNTVPAQSKNQYLGPIIVAHKDRPVRIKLINNLPLHEAGNLPLPVDHTYMGAAGQYDTDNRTAMHLHGGNTPWISDGTPRQWIKPANENGVLRGESATDVPDMWFYPSTQALFTDVNGVAITNPTAKQITDNALTTNPGPGALTYYYTNEQSARLMFYHDHAEGITRLNVYDGMAAGYLLQDSTEQDLVNGTNVSGNNIARLKVLPSIQDTIPLVIQEKTFVPDNTPGRPVLNSFGPFATQLNSQDPTWRWGTGTPVECAAGASTALPAYCTNGNGDLWVPHVFMPNQNPGDISGANSFGRWDYGPWFWPPFTGIQHGAVANPYYDSACVSSALNYCEGQTIPGVPNGANNLVTDGGNSDTTAANILTNPLNQPSGTPESFNDTPLVNGTAYPVLKVDPKQYRLRLLSVGNDRVLNLSLVVAASNAQGNPITALQNAGKPTGATKLCDGGTTSASETDRSKCTEARMVPFNDSQDTVSKFPSWWYTRQNAGVTFDGRPSGVFDPATRGPAMVQIGTDGGFLSTPVIIQNQPTNFEYNLKNIVVTNVKEHALLLGPAERADVLVDFANFAGATLLMYNDSPAPMPAFDLRVDYFTGDYDNTDTGGAFSTLPGYGPNTRTIMQIQVSNTGGAAAAATSQDDTGNIDIANLTSAVQTAFKTSQEHIIVPQAAYNATYGIEVADSTLATGSSLSSAINHNLALIQDYALNFTPYTVDSLTGLVSGLGQSVPMDMQPKTIIEDWTMDYGRMNALLGVEIPKTSATTNTALPLGYTDPPTELVKLTPNATPISGTLTDGTQLWRITHNGVDSHAIHFHLFHVQIVNRVGWDGTIRQTEANELGWKDTVRMNPLEDVVVALRPRVISNLPFKVPNSHRLLDPALAQDAVAQPTGAAQNFFNLDPQTGNASTVTNVNINYGWEYVWHCHILGHEENDMMRSIAVAQTPEAPDNVKAVTSGSNKAPTVTVSWNDNSVISNWVTIQRAMDSNFTTGLATFNVAQPECTSQAGCPRNWVDSSVEAGQNSVFYKVISNNTVGAGDYLPSLPATLLPTTAGGGITTPTANLAGYDNVTTESAISSGATGTGSRILPISPTALDFGSVQVPMVSAPQVVTVTNLQNSQWTVSSVAICVDTTTRTKTTTVCNPLNNGGYTITNNGCITALALNQSCTIAVKLTPDTAGVKTAKLAITTVRGTGASIVNNVAMTGTGVLPTASLVGTLDFGNQQVGAASTPTTMFTYTNTGAGPITLSSNATGVTLTGVNSADYRIVSDTCSGVTLPPTTNNTCTIGVSLTPTVLGAENAVLTVNAIPSFPTTSLSASLTGTGVAPLPPTAVIPTTLLPAPTPNGPFTKSSTDATVLTFNWIASAGTAITGYEVQQCAASATACTATKGTWVPLGVVLGTSSSYGVTGLDPSIPSYVFRVRATVANSSVTSAWLISPSVTTLATPAAPTASSIAATTLTLNWVSVPGAVSYTVQRAANVGFTGTVTTIATGVIGTTQAVTGLAGNKTYYFRVQALSAPNTTTNIANTVSGVASDPVTTLQVTPTAPVFAASTLVSTNGFTANWNAPTGTTSYIVSVNGAAAISQVATSITVSGLNAGSSNTVTVAACSNKGTTCSAVTSKTQLTLPAAPSISSVSSVTATGMTVNWAPVANAAGYTLQYSINGGTNWATMPSTGRLVKMGTALTGASTSAVITGMAAYTSYSFQLQVANAAGNSGYGSFLTQLTQPLAPAFTTSTGVTTTGFTANWNPPTSGAASYNLSVNGATAVSQVATSITVSGLNADSRNTVTVAACSNSDGTNCSPAITLTQLTLPAAPSISSVSLVTASGMTVNWATVANATGYTLQYSIDGGTNWAKMPSTGTGVVKMGNALTAKSISAVITGMAANTSYSFQLQVANAAGNSGYGSSWTQLTLP